MNIKDISVTRLAGLSLSIILLAVFTLGGIAYHQAQDIWKNAALNYEYPFQTRIVINEIESNVLNMRMDIRNFLLAEKDASRQAILKNIYAEKSNVLSGLDKLGSLYMGPGSDIETLRKEFLKWVSIREESVRLVRAGKISQAQQRHIQGGIAPVQALKVLAAVHVIDNFAQNNSRKFYAAAKQEKNRLLQELVFVIFIILLLCAAAGYLLFKFLLQPIRELTAVVVRYGRGELALRSAYASANEAGALAAAFNFMADTILSGKALKEKSEELVRNQGLLDSLIQNTPFPIAVADAADNSITMRSRSAQEKFGHTALNIEEWYKLAYPDPAYRQEVMRRWKPFMEKAKASGRPVNAGEYNITCKDGSVRVCELYASFLSDSLIVTFNDITERKSLEEQLRQAQKMESVGRLAGGVAHDFNNLVTAINGYAKIVLNSLPPEDVRRSDIQEILNAGDRAAGLTQQLLAFSRKQILKLEALDINPVIESVGKMLKRLVGEHIAVKINLHPSQSIAKIDKGQIHQILVNLAVNSRDAMPKGGTLTITTDVAVLPDTFFKDKAMLKPGPLVVLSVADTGCGMTDEIKAHLFEPFFTTKGQGKGTGLGLSTIYGIVKQSGGEIEVESAPGNGTTFKIYLPQCEQDKEKEKEKDKGTPSEGSETILFVEDEDSLRRLGVRILSASGYTVLAAANGMEALKVLEQHGRPVDLLITDMIMPGMSGRELALTVAGRKMARKTLYTSGYTDETIVEQGVLQPGTDFLYKPYSPDALLRITRAILEGRV